MVFLNTSKNNHNCIIIAPMKYKNIREEELKNKVGADWFKDYDTTEIIGNIDFSVYPKQDNLFGRTSLLWAEAKTGVFDITAMFVQLILTIGKARTFDKTLPPAFLGAFDFKNIAFVPYISVQDIFYMNDFNWNVTSSNHSTKEFTLIKDRVEAILKTNTYVFDYLKDDKDLRTFIANNIAKASEASKIKIDKNNFIPIYLRWLEFVKPIIDVNWEELKKANILDSDFYLADLFVDDKDTQSISDDQTIRENLFVVFQNQGYKIRKEDIKQMFDATINLKSKDTYQQFWKRYKRPPIKSFQDYIIERRDLLVPQDIRERKGAFFTPRQWVELSQKYLADILGENWQEEYYIWDCAAGTGNLLAGLTNKYNIWASTLDQADVNVMQERIEHGANLLESHVFQFDFLNDEFSKLPQGLQDIINDEEKRKKLVIYINPPYAEASSYGFESIPQVANETIIFKKFKDEIGAEALNELFAQFFVRIFKEIPYAFLASFSTPKYITSDKFIKFRANVKAEYLKGFVCRADTFDNVKGQFPIGFLIWKLNSKNEIHLVETDIYEIDNNSKTPFFSGLKKFTIVKGKSIAVWRSTFYSLKEIPIGFMVIVGPSMQSNNNTFITNENVESYRKKGMLANISEGNLIPMAIYLTCRKVINTSWLNNKDSFLFPNDDYLFDIDFHNDCLTFTLFSNSNNISNSFGLNHWIPFTEQEVDAKEKFESTFMSDFINGKASPSPSAGGGVQDMFKEKVQNTSKGKREFSAEAAAVFDAGRALWKYYHAQKFPSAGGVAESRGGYNVNASLYDIREHFQGRNDTGKMNNKSGDETYTKLIADLRESLKVLAKKIEPKVYEYGFLKE